MYNNFTLLGGLILILHLFNLFHDSCDAQTFAEEFPNVKFCVSHILIYGKGRGGKTILSELRRLEKMKCTHLPHSIRINNVNSKAIINLDSLEELRGDIKITNSKVKRISFKKLRVIRGDSNIINSITWKNKKYILSLQISGNSELEHVDFRNLMAIHRHNVYFADNKKLTYIPHSIDWKQLFHNSKEQTFINNDEKWDHKFKCSSDCKPFNGKKHCWGPSSEECQIVQRCTDEKFCSFCYHNKNSDDPHICCNSECVTGCFGYSSKHCHVCKNAKYRNRCKQSCPPRYRPAVAGHVLNEKFRYYVEGFCAKQCPVHMVVRYNQCFYTGSWLLNSTAKA